VPAGRIVGDGAGFDTYDSCARARLVYRVPRMIVVTQSYHLPRAVTLCRAAGVDAIGVGDDSVRLRRFSWWKGTAREQLACVKAAYDVATRSVPVSLGPPDDAVRRALDG
jgi:vancomycin permeability regulator SanA